MIATYAYSARARWLFGYALRRRKVKMKFLTDKDHAQIIEDIEQYQVKRQDFDRFSETLSTLKSAQTVTDEGYNVCVDGVHIPDDVVKKAVFLYMTRSM